MQTIPKIINEIKAMETTTSIVDYDIINNQFVLKNSLIELLEVRRRDFLDCVDGRYIYVSFEFKNLCIESLKQYKDDLEDVTNIVEIYFGAKYIGPNIAYKNGKKINVYEFEW